MKVKSQIYDFHEWISEHQKKKQRKKNNYMRG